MGTFSVFMAIWCFALVLFPVASVTSLMNKENDEVESENSISGERTVFLDDFNKKEIFSLAGNYSDQQIVEHDGKTYLVYFDKTEDDVIYMCIKAVVPAQLDDSAGSEQ